MKKKYLVFLLVLCLCGCFGRKAPVEKVILKPEPEVKGNLIDPEQLRLGGNLGFIAFKAGPQAESNDQLDRLSMLLLKGIRESIEASNIPISISDDEAKANLFLEGYIEEYYKPGKIARWVLRKKNPRLSVSGDIWYKGTGKKVLTFAASKIVNNKKSKIEEEAYQMGRSIGEYIVSTTVKE